MQELVLSTSSVISQMSAIGFDSLGISLSIVFIAACVIALQVAHQFLMSGGDSYIGGFLAVALIREIAPGFAFPIYLLFLFSLCSKPRLR